MSASPEIVRSGPTHRQPFSLSGPRLSLKFRTTGSFSNLYTLPALSWLRQEIRFGVCCWHSPTPRVPSISWYLGTWGYVPTWHGLLANLCDTCHGTFNSQNLHFCLHGYLSPSTLPSPILGSKALSVPACTLRTRFLFRSLTRRVSGFAS